MTLSRIVHIAAVLSGLAVVPAAAADLDGYYVKAAPIAVPAPYYVVNQGPVISGPGIVVTEIGFSATVLSHGYPYVRSYPFIGVPVTANYHDVVPLNPAARIDRNRAFQAYDEVRKVSHRKVSKASHRKVSKVSHRKVSKVSHRKKSKARHAKKNTPQHAKKTQHAKKMQQHAKKK